VFNKNKIGNVTNFFFHQFFFNEYRGGWPLNLMAVIKNGSLFVNYLKIILKLRIALVFFYYIKTKSIYLFKDLILDGDYFSNRRLAGNQIGLL
jgi:hypothetical protein